MQQILRQINITGWQVQLQIQKTLITTTTKIQIQSDKKLIKYIRALHADLTHFENSAELHANTYIYANRKQTQKRRIFSGTRRKNVAFQR